MSKLPRDWAEAALADICLPVEKHDPRERPDDLFVYIDIGGIENQRIIGTKSMKGSEAPSRARQLVCKGDTVLSTVRTYLKKTAVVPSELDGATASTGFCVLRPATGIAPRFVFYRVAAPDFVSRLTLKQTGSSYPAVRDHDVFEEQIAVPPLNEQRRIVAAIEEQFSRLDTAVESLYQAQRRVAVLRDAVYAAAISGEWPTAKLGDLLREPLRNGHSAKAARDGKVRTLTLTAVTRSEFSDENTKLTSADPARIENLWLEPGDVLIERSNTPELVGTAALYRGSQRWAIFPDLLIRIRVTNDLLPEFLEIVLKSRPARRYFQASAQGIAGSMPKIDQGTVEQLGVPLPPLDEQRRIVAEVKQRLSVIDAMRAAIEAAQLRSAALRRSILERAFRGELVPQDPADEPASVLLKRIAVERATAEAANGRRPRRRATMEPR